MKCICAMKDRARLAQSLIPQDIEKMGIFIDFSSPRKAVSGTSQKRDSAADPAPLLRGFASVAATDLAGLDGKNLTGRTNVGECGRVGAGHPDLGAEL